MIGVLLMTFGSAVTADEVPGYLGSIARGGEVSPQLVAEFQRRFRRIGRSPLIEITLAQAEALQRLLDERHGKDRFRVAVGMQHSAPWIADSVTALAGAGCDRIVGIVLAPQYSPLILGGYERAAAAARAAYPLVRFDIAGSWHDLPAWIASLAERVNAEQASLPSSTPVIVTAHSLPRAVVDLDPAYIDQLNATAALLTARLDLDSSAWRFAWQSAGHTPVEWLQPDLAEVLADVAAAGHRDVLVVPLQFLAEHLEVLYDIDVAAQEQAADAGVRLRRIGMPNSSPAIIRALADVVAREVPHVAIR